MKDESRRALREHPEGVVVSIRVVPGARVSEVVGVDDGSVRMRVAAPPVDGKANQAALELLADVLGVRARQLTLLRGDRSRNKQVLVTGLSADEADALLPPSGGSSMGAQR